MTIKSFRGQIANDGKETISLHTNDGSTGYRIVKLEVIGTAPGTVHIESVLKIFTIPQTGTPTGTIDFSDNTLIACAYYEDNTGTTQPTSIVTVFDNMVFNQDIYLTHKEVSTDAYAINYHIELEQIKLDISKNTVATLKDIRNITG